MPIRYPILAAGLLLLIPGAPLPAQTPPPADPPLPTDTAIRQGVLPNGLHYYLRRHDYPAGRAELRLVVDAGSVLEGEDQRGLAHLLEHLAFDGTPQFPGHSVWKFFERIGMSVGADVNATTGTDETIYQLTLPTDSGALLTAGLTLMEEWAHRLTFDSTELVRERKVVVEEWRSGLGASRRLSTRRLEALLSGSRYPDRLPIGDPDLVSAAPLSAVRRFYADWYRPERMAVIVVGAIDPDSLEPLIRGQFGRVAAAASPLPPPVPAPPPIPGPRVVVVPDSETTTSSVTLHYRRTALPLRTRADFRRLLAEHLYDDLVNQRLDARTLDPSPPFLGAGAGDAGLVRGLRDYQLSASVADGGIGRGLSALLAEVARVDREGFTEGEFQRATIRLLRRLTQVEEQRSRIPSSGLADQLAGDHLSGDPTLDLDLQLSLARELLPGLSAGEVRATGARRRQASPPVILISLPAGGVVPTEAELLATLEAPADSLGGYAEAATDSLLLPGPPVGGRLRRADRIGAIGVQRLELANGVRVLLKSTRFGQGEVLLAAYRDGGTSVVGDDLLVPAASAEAIVCGSGVGGFDPLRLRRLLAGKVVGLGCDIGDRQEGISGSSAPADLETLLQLVYLQFTAPRLDSAVYRQYRARLDGAVAHRAADPGTALGDTLFLLLSDHSPRQRLLDSAFVEALDPDRSLGFFRDRFGDAGGFTFVLVGAFDADSVLPLVTRYLGGLPAGGGRARDRRAPAVPPNGVVTRVIHKGHEPRSTTIMVFHAAGSAAREEPVALAALSQILRQRLQDRLRQQLAGVYGVEVGAELVTEPGPSYRISVEFSADPERREELAAAVRAEAAALAERGPTKEELAAFREERRRSLETARQTNGWWLRMIAQADQWGWPLERILSDREAERLTREAVRRMAQRCLRDANRIEVALLPE